MAAEEQHPKPDASQNDDKMPSSEQTAMMDFAHSLGSCNLTCEPGIADDGNTRQEAKLLMSLLSKPPRLDNEDSELVSSSESDVSYHSDSSVSRRESFSFTCPSLSLENSSSIFMNSVAQPSLPSGDICANFTPHTPSRRTPDSPTSPGTSAETPRPAVLLGRPLKVDDRDALRLSADAMARNILQSFQKAMAWRVQAWIQSLSTILVGKEQEMLRSGASNEDLKSLLATPEAQLIVKLRETSDLIHITGAGTSFRVLPQRVRSKESKEPEVKKRRFESSPSCPLSEDGEEKYKVVHALMLDIVVNLDTPAGYSEINLEVPGTMEGTFHRPDGEAEHLTSVKMEINTEILAAMVEKSCRTVVRSSIELMMAQQDSENQSQEDKEDGADSSATATTKGAKAAMSEYLVSPPPRPIDQNFTAEYVRSVLVTPRKFGGLEPRGNKHERSAKPVLMPMPDDFDEPNGPRRITPQPTSPSFDNALHASLMPRTPKSTSTLSGPQMISPAARDSSDDEVPKNGPSLPILVEVACRAMNADK